MNPELKGKKNGDGCVGRREGKKKHLICYELAAQPLIIKVIKYFCPKARKTGRFIYYIAILLQYEKEVM